MNKINLEDFLLASIQSPNPLKFRKQLYFGKKCFIVEFTLKGKNLVIDDIYKRRKRRPTFQKRCLRRWRTLRHQYLNKQEERLLHSFDLNGRTEKSSQTKLIRSRTRSTTTQKIILEFKTIQTEESSHCHVSKACQTSNSVIFNSVGVQNKRKTMTHETQTENIVHDIECQTDALHFMDFGVQVRPKSAPFETQTSETWLEGEFGAESLKDDQQNLIFMLNEIGEINLNNLIMSQKHINLSRKIFQLLEQLVIAQKLQYQIMQPISRIEEFFQKHPAVSESTQTESHIDVQDQETQTLLPVEPQRRWRIFEKPKFQKSKST